MENETLSGRGGKREGAGRKAFNLPLKMRSYKATDEEDLVIKRWLKKRHGNSQ